jgi:hypothetical protein
MHKIAGLRTVHAIWIDQELKPLADFSRNPRRLDAFHRFHIQPGLRGTAMRSYAE